MKRHITLFFCDINGTIDGEMTELDIHNFNNNLEEIRIKNNSDYLFFNFASSEQDKVLFNYGVQISRFFKEKVCLYYDEDTLILKDYKVAYILKNINKLSKHFVIDEIYFADDCVLTHDLLRNLLIDYDINLVSIISDKRLSVINECLENKIDDFNKRKELTI